jgi:hypothetical protein
LFLVRKNIHEEGHGGAKLFTMATRKQMERNWKGLGTRHTLQKHAFSDLLLTNRLTSWFLPPPNNATKLSIDENID